jgi:hypothetical protein
LLVTWASVWADHLERMGSDEILSRSAQVEKIDTVARRNYGLEKAGGGTGTLNVAVLAGVRAVVQVESGTGTIPEPTD